MNKSDTITIISEAIEGGLDIIAKAPSFNEGLDKAAEGTGVSIDDFMEFMEETYDDAEEATERCIMDAAFHREVMRGYLNTKPFIKEAYRDVAKEIGKEKLLELAQEGTAMLSYLAPGEKSKEEIEYFRRAPIILIEESLR